MEERTSGCLAKTPSPPLYSSGLPKIFDDLRFYLCFLHNPNLEQKPPPPLPMALRPGFSRGGEGVFARQREVSFLARRQAVVAAGRCVLCLCPCTYDESRAVRGVWAYNRVERGRARMQLQFLDMLLNLLFYSWSLSCSLYYYSALRADDGAAAFL